ncbi:RICIN domain-containing protein [Micromonospora zamorensis]|uniref:RICIN domain-containing protein n=1 Tax=Micromonospora zamorensis TaxID=709883 RepID=UPI002E2CA472|nr:RICIN domain-containing protein [Micromonospora zamorensis]
MRTQPLKRLLARATVMTMALGAALFTTALPAQAQYVSVYKNHSSLQNFAKPWTKLGIAGQDPNYGRAGEWTATSSYSEWRITDHPPYGHQIREYYQPNRCLDSNAAGQAYGIVCNGGAYQRWHFNYLGTQRDVYYNRVWNVYEIRNAATGRCLDADGVNGYTNPCNGGDYQRWFLIDINM